MEDTEASVVEMGLCSEPYIKRDTKFKRFFLLRLLLLTYLLVQNLGANSLKGTVEHLLVTQHDRVSQNSPAPRVLLAELLAHLALEAMRMGCSQRSDAEGHLEEKSGANTGAARAQGSQPRETVSTFFLEKGDAPPPKFRIPNLKVGRGDCYKRTKIRRGTSAVVLGPIGDTHGPD